MSSVQSNNDKISQWESTMRELEEHRDNLFSQAEIYKNKAYKKLNADLCLVFNKAINSLLLGAEIDQNHEEFYIVHKMCKDELDALRMLYKEIIKTTKAICDLELTRSFAKLEIEKGDIALFD